MEVYKHKDDGEDQTDEKDRHCDTIEFEATLPLGIVRLSRSGHSVDAHLAVICTARLER